MELLRALGLDWKIFLTQLFNFALLYFVLAKAALPENKSNEGEKRARNR